MYGSARQSLLLRIVAPLFQCRLIRFADHDKHCLCGVCSLGVYPILLSRHVDHLALGSVSCVWIGSTIAAVADCRAALPMSSYPVVCGSRQTLPLRRMLLRCLSHSAFSSCRSCILGLEAFFIGSAQNYPLRVLSRSVTFMCAFRGLTPLLKGRDHFASVSYAGAVIALCVTLTTSGTRPLNLRASIVHHSRSMVIACMGPNACIGTVTCDTNDINNKMK